MRCSRLLTQIRHARIELRAAALQRSCEFTRSHDTASAGDPLRLDDCRCSCSLHRVLLGSRAGLLIAGLAGWSRLVFKTRNLLDMLQTGPVTNASKNVAGIRAFPYLTHPISAWNANAARGRCAEALIGLSMAEKCLVGLSPDLDTKTLCGLKS